MRLRFFLKSDYLKMRQLVHGYGKLLIFPLIAKKEASTVCGEKYWISYEIYIILYKKCEKRKKNLVSLLTSRAKYSIILLGTGI